MTEIPAFLFSKLFFVLVQSWKTPHSVIVSEQRCPFQGPRKYPYTACVCVCVCVCGTGHLGDLPQHTQHAFRREREREKEREGANMSERERWERGGGRGG